MEITSDTKIYAGANEIAKVYKGSESIYNHITLPYIPLNYIESTGTQYINANLPNNTSGFKVELKFQFTDDRNRQFIFGAEGSNPYYRDYLKRESPILIDVGAYMYNGVNFSLVVGTTYEVVVKTLGNRETSLTIDNESVWSTTEYLSNKRTELTPYIFALNQRGKPLQNEFAYMKLYYIRFYDRDDNILRNFIPVKDLNNVPCLYDKVSETFFYNLGTESFLYG